LSAPPPFGDRHRFLFEGRNWSVYLYRNQGYLGRCVVYLTTRALKDPLELTDDEREELWTEVLPKLTRALTAAFQPDRFTYAHLANRLHHVHWHVVPRYDVHGAREFAGHTFTDRRRGKVFRTKRFRASKKVRKAIYAQVKQHLEESELS
jgi:diadenosine tetraphosphate (Ap4A) HIT family hydrolase